MWGAVAVAAAWAGVVVTATREGPVVERRPPAEFVSPAEAMAPVASPEVDPLRRTGVPSGPAWTPGEVPPGDREQGRASLRLRLVSDADDRPVEMEVRLWRLGVAENATWTEGDEVRSLVRVERNGYAFDLLPRGRYRVQCLDLREDADDPPEFVLDDGVNVCVLSVANRRTFRVRVRILDETGAPRRHAILQRGPGGHSWRPDPGLPPAWATPREARTGRRATLSASVSTACSQGEPGTPADSDDGTFELDSFQQRGRRGRSDRRYVIRVGTDACTTVTIDDEVDGDSTFVWVVPRPVAVVAHVMRPDGKPLDPATAFIEVQSEAVRFGWHPPDDAWRTLPVKVTVALPGCDSLVFTWTAATADTPRVLVPKSPK